MLKHFTLSHLLLLRGYRAFFMHPQAQACLRHHRVRTSSASPSTTARSRCMQGLPLESSTFFISLSYDDARQLMREGGDEFRRGHVKESTRRFDEVYGNFSALRPYLWQRGISLYYAGRFREASEQFKLDVRVNPNDVEEIVWDAASMLQLVPEVFPPEDMMSVPSPRRDRRRIMTPVYRLFRGEGSERDLFVAGHDENSSPSDEFYSLFYLGLFCEVRGEVEKARQYMVQSLRTPYARGGGKADYMTAVAMVHCHERGWT